MSDRQLPLDPDLLLQAYAAGIFPMAESRNDPELFWVDPRLRGVLPLEGFHVSRSLARRLRRAEYTATLNADFAGTVDGCADRAETWINGQIRSLYMELHARGHAHSLEIWQDDVLAGGVYGVTLGGAFFGESMFSRRTDASKLALAHLTGHLRRCGFVLFDTQFQTDHLASLGAEEIPRAVYRDLLRAALEVTADINYPPFDPSSHWVVQRNTQIS
ncbi:MULTISPECIES: leucyl/phenylalanyl-tRNA--protein transferase [unclassified Roseovarius]|uniref:leucyl/phenylalanyl-tRNA--protein transferase n=1 Tax=unclassified Roseovarius TaxID=2614913 RepID=UPI00273FEC7D|nr:leucyl/phenylalanyl-tRNA--protein transferase [Roseovarius sp. MMSF_3350]